MTLVSLIAPELVLIAVACGLILLGVSSKASARRMAPIVAVATLAFVFLWQLINTAGGVQPSSDEWHTVTQNNFTAYVKTLVAGVGVLLVLLAWPTNRQATGSASMDFGHDAGEFFALMLLSLAAVMLVSVANDIILLFLAVELASIPTYIMVSISRPLPVAQEAGVKYFFLGAMAAAIMLFGFSYLYGTTGMTKLDQIAGLFDQARAAAGTSDTWLPAPLTTWQLLAIVMMLAGFAFKIAAVPLHAYAGDVYQGAATPVTAFLAFVPKTSGFVAIIKTLFAVGGTHWAVPPIVVNTLIVVAAFTMSVGNVLGLLQFNVKRVLAYSSIAHSGYMLVGLSALAHAATLPHGSAGEQKFVENLQANALGGVLFYLAAYGLMNVGAFGVLMLLPSRTSAYGSTLGVSGAATAMPPPATTAETFEDLAGTGRRHLGLGLAMAVCCFSLIGLPLTVGFFGKLYLITPALSSGLTWLVVITMINAAVSAAYYLRIVATMFLRPAPETEAAFPVAPLEPAHATAAGASADRPAKGSPQTEDEPRGWALPLPIASAVALSAVGTLLLGTVLPMVNSFTSRVKDAARLQNAPAATVQTVRADTPASPADR